MKVFAIASALFFVCSTAAAISSPADPVANEALAARDASPDADPGWWGFSWSRRGQGGWKRDAEAAADPSWGFKWSRRGQGSWKRDASPEPFNWSRRGQGSWKRDATTPDKPMEEEDDFIYLPNGMTPEDFAQMLQHKPEKEPADGTQ